MDKDSPAVHARGTALRSDDSAGNKEMCALRNNITTARLVAINSVEVKCSITVG